MPPLPPRPLFAKNGSLANGSLNIEPKQIHTKGIKEQVYDEC